MTPIERLEAIAGALGEVLGHIDALANEGVRLPLDIEWVLGELASDARLVARRLKQEVGHG